MSPVLATRRDKRALSTGWIWRMMLGVGLIGFSLWGISICPLIFQTFIGPNPSPMETTFAKLAAAVAWLVFFGPIALGGLVVLWSTLRKMGALDWLETVHEDTTATVLRVHSGREPHGLRVFPNEGTSSDGLETLSEENVARLKNKAYRIATLLGLSTGTLLIVIGVFGLIFVSSPSARFSMTIQFAIASGICILAGLAVLQRTLGKENNAWLFPLKVFTHVVLRRGSISADNYKSRSSERAR